MNVGEKRTESIELIYLGHAGYILKNQTTALLMDPWISGKAFMGSWVIDPYADPEYKFTRVLNILSEINNLYIWISHEHSDHFDKWFIRKLIGHYIQKKIAFLIPGFPGNSLKKSLTALGATKVISMSDQEQKTINALGEIQIFFERPYYSEHSSLLICADDINIFHNSDSTLTNEQLSYIQNRFDGIDIYIGQYGPSSPFPAVMEWTDEKKKFFQSQHERWALNRYLNATNVLKPSLGLMCAGPAAVRNLKGEWGEKYCLSKSNLRKCIDKNNLRPLPFSRFIKDSKSGVITEIVEDPSEVHDQRVSAEAKEGIDSYIQDNFLQDIECDSLPAKYFNRLELIAPLVSKHITIEWRELCESSPEIHRLVFSQSGLKYVKPLQMSSISRTISGEYNIASIPKKILRLFFTGQITWDELSYSRYYSVSQSENGFLPLFIQALRCIHNEELFNSFIADKFKTYNNNIMQVSYESAAGKSLTKQIKRYCPHQNFDLRGTDSINKNILTCPMHGHKFNLDTGSCIFGDQTKNILRDV